MPAAARAVMPRTSSPRPTPKPSRVSRTRSTSSPTAVAPATSTAIRRSQRLRGVCPDLADRVLYEGVVAQRLGSDASRAGEIVRRAEESFTEWPVERELKFRHVVHYLIFDEYMRSGNVREGTKTNMGAVVARIIPEEI